MKAVFLDVDTLGPEDLDLHPLLNQLTDCTLHPFSDPVVVAERIAQTEVLLVNKVAITPEHLGQSRHLKLICLAATGTDNIALDAARENGIAVANIRNYCTPSVVQHVFNLILALNQRLIEFSNSVSTGRWTQSNTFCVLDHRFAELSGKTLGIVGYGTLGQAVAAVGRAFGMRVVAASSASGKTNSSAVDRLPFDDLLALADVISLHCPLNKQTENLFNADSFARMKPGALLINTARGKLVDSDALISALQANQISGAGIDVLSEEPPADTEPLVKTRLPNLLVTPHIAWAARESRQRAVQEMAANIAAFRAGQSRNRVV